MHFVKAQTRNCELTLCPRASLPALASTLRKGLHSFYSLALVGQGSFAGGVTPPAPPQSYSLGDLGGSIFCIWAERSSLFPFPFLPYPQAVEKC